MTEKYNYLVDFLRSSWPKVIIHDTILDALPIVDMNIVEIFITSWKKLKPVPLLYSIKGKEIHSGIYSLVFELDQRNIYNVNLIIAKELLYIIKTEHPELLAKMNEQIGVAV